MKTTLIAIVFSAFLSGCLNQKQLSKNQTVFKVENIGANSEIRAYNNKNNKLKVTIEESNSTLFIKRAPGETRSFPDTQVVRSNFFPANNYAQLELSGKLYFCETTFPKPGDVNSNAAFITPKSLKYSENKLVLQALSVPVKIRSAIKNLRYKDSLPTQAETGFNAGLAGGFKRTWSVFKPEQNLLGQNTTKFSTATGLLFNIGGTDVKKSTTNYTIVVDRKEPFYCFGWFFLFGINNINIGYSIGSDHLFSANKKNWVYNGKIWHGVTLALDILK